MTSLKEIFIKRVVKDVIRIYRENKENISKGKDLYNFCMEDPCIKSAISDKAISKAELKQLITITLSKIGE